MTNPENNPQTIASIQIFSTNLKSKKLDRIPDKKIIRNMTKNIFIF